MTAQTTIKVGDYVVIERQNYRKLFKFSSLSSTVIVGKQKIALRNIVDQLFFTTFRIITPSNIRKRDLVSTLEVCSDSDKRSLRSVLEVQECGTDNRNIVDDGESQVLKSDDIEKLRENCSGSHGIIEKIVENSKTFSHKTEFSQEKYLNKKAKKYFEFIRVLKPSIRMLMEIYYRQNADDVMGVRNDALAQIISYSGVSSHGNYLLYDSGSNGLLAAAFLNSMGPETSAKLINMHPGNVPQSQAVAALNFPTEQLARCISVNIYSVVRKYNSFQHSDVASTGAKRKLEEEDDDQAVETKKKRLDDSTGQVHQPIVTERQEWEVENAKAIEVLKEKVDGLVIVAREHPFNIVNALLPYLKPSGSLVVFSTSREVLAELYVHLKSSSPATCVRLTSTWTRMYQILPDRTHPEVNLKGSSGFILTALNTGK